MNKKTIVVKASDFDRPPRPQVLFGGFALGEGVETTTGFDKLHRMRTVGDTIVFTGLVGGEVVAERIQRVDGVEKRAVERPPTRMEDWPPCECGHERLDHDMWGNTTCEAGRCGCEQYRVPGLDTAPVFANGGDGWAGAGSSTADILADLDRVAQQIREIPPAAVRIDAPREVLAIIREQLPKFAVDERFRGFVDVGVPLLLDDELPAHTIRVRMSDGTAKLVDIRDGSSRPIPT